MKRRHTWNRFFFLIHAFFLNYLKPCAFQSHGSNEFNFLTDAFQSHGSNEFNFLTTNHPHALCLSRSDKMKLVAVTTPAWQCSCEPLRCGIPMASAFKSTGLYMESVAPQGHPRLTLTLTLTLTHSFARLERLWA